MTTTRLIGGILLGAAIGTAAGLLMAPASGKKTRNDIARKSRKLNKQMNKALKRSVSELRETYNTKLTELAGTGKQAVDALRNSVKVS